MVESEPIEQGGDEAKKGEKAKTKTWSNVVKVLKTEDEMGTTNLGESGKESKTTYLVRMFDSETLNQLKARRKRRQYYDNKGA